MEKATASKLETISVVDDGVGRNIEVFVLRLRTTTGKRSKIQQAHRHTDTHKIKTGILYVR